MAVVRILHLADVHLDTPFGWAAPEVARQLRHHLREALQRATQLVGRGGFDALTIAGDLYEHDRFSADTGAFLQATFAELAPVPVLIAPGNHDWFGPQSLYRQVEWSPNVVVFDSSTFTRFALADGVTVWGAAHLRPAHTPNLLNGFHTSGSETHLALFHGSEQGGLAFQEAGKQVHAPFDEADIAAAGFAFALVGHYHRARAGRWYAYPGNPSPLSFGETGERGALVIDVAVSGVTATPVALATSPWHDVAVDATGCSSATEVRARIAERLATLRGMARVTVSGELAPDVHLGLDDLRGVEHPLEAYMPQFGEVTVAYDVDALTREQTVRGQFVRDVLDAAELEDDLRRRILVTGLRAFDGRADLEVP